MPESDAGGNPPEGYFTAEQVEEARRAAIEQARKEERDKLYPRIEKTDERFKEMSAEVDRLKAADAEREKAAAKLEADAEKARKKAADAELSAKDLIEKRNAEWQAQLDKTKSDQAEQLAEIRRNQELQQAMWDKEREMVALQDYIRARVDDERDNIAPELLDFIDGTTKEQVDASIDRVKAKTAQIVEGMRQAQIGQRAGMPGVALAGGATAITPGLDTGDKTLSPEDIKGMSMQDFMALRQKVGMGTSGSGRGIFG